MIPSELHVYTLYVKDTLDSRWQVIRHHEWTKHTILSLFTEYIHYRLWKNLRKISGNGFYVSDYLCDSYRLPTQSHITKRIDQIL